ncbi:MAG: peptidoglycan DD-metalloendopeptidase family protein [Desulfarculus sp.]|nr:peptidoglycan DD-metalloendopeptidase family protein [Desulfarculus sp.]
MSGSDPMDANPQTASAASPAALAKARALDPQTRMREQAKLRQACQLFEAQFLKTLWKEMRKTVPKAGLINGGQAEQMFTDLLDQAVSDSSVKGRSMGIAQMLEKQLSRERVQRPSGQLPSPGLAPPLASTLPATPAPTVKGLIPPAGRYPAGTASLGEFQMPVQGVVSSAFGEREHPITGEERAHNGLDLAAPAGTPVAAAKAGVVSFAGASGDYGNLVIVDHPGGGSTYYAHLQSMRVKAGQALEQGQELGQVGSTGLATGPHLHFEVRDGLGRAVDPQPLLAKGLNLAT